MTGFQKQVNQTWAPGVEGAIASLNPLINYVTGPGGLVSGPSGVIVGRFGWCADDIRVDNNAALIAAGSARTLGMGFIANEQQGLSTVYLAESGMGVLPGQAMEMFTRGDFWALMKAAATRGQKVFANLLDGTAYPAAAGSTVQAATMTASFATTVMTVTVIDNAVLAVGVAITGTGVPANTYIASLGTGTGGTGTYNLTTTPGTVGSAAGIIASKHIETRWSVLSAALNGEIAKIGFGD